MKIALLGPSYPFRGGIAYYTTLLYQNLKKQHHVRFFGFKRQYPRLLFPGNTDRDNSQAPFNMNEIEYTLDSLQPLTWLQTARAILVFEPDLVIIPWWVSFWAPQFFSIARIINRGLKNRILFICHNVVEHESNAIKKSVTQKVLGNGQYFLVHSAQEKRRLQQLFPGVKVRKVLMPSFEVIKNGKISRKEARSRLNLHRPTLLFFGFVRKYKGLDLLLRAMPAVLDRMEVQLLIVGEFWQDKGEYLNLISSLGLQRYVTIVDRYVPNEEVELYFAAANLLVMPYRTVTGSAVIQLSFSLGLPVLVSDIGALAEIVTDQQTGFVVPEGDVQAISRRILFYFQNRCEEKFRQAIVKDRERFSWNHLVRNIEQLVKVNA